MQLQEKKALVMIYSMTMNQGSIRTTMYGSKNWHPMSLYPSTGTMWVRTMLMRT